MLNIQELANFITEKLNIISTTKNAGYVFDIYAENGKGKDDGSIKGVVKSLPNNPLIVKSLVSVKTIYRVELAIPNGMDNKNLVKIEDIIGEFVKTYEGTQQTFTGGVGSFELTYAHLEENYTIKNEIGGIVPLQFEMTVNFTDNGLLGSSKIWLLNGVEIPYLNEVILLNKEGQTNRISKEKYNKTIVLAQTKYYKFTIPFDKTNTVCTTLQADLLNGDFSKTYTLEYYDGVTYTQENPFMTTVSLFQSGDSGSDGGEISKFTVTFADVSADELVPKYTLELFSTPFDENNERWFDSVEEQTSWYDSLPNRTPAVQIKAPNLNTISNTTQVYDFNGIDDFPYTPTELANMNVARINRKTNDVNTYHYQINTRRGQTIVGRVSGWDYDVPYQYKTGVTEYCPITLAGTTYYLRFVAGEPQLSYADGTIIPIDEYYGFSLDYSYYLREDDGSYYIVDWNGTIITSLLKTTVSSSVDFTINDRVFTLSVTMADGQVQSIKILEDGDDYADITTTKQFDIEIPYFIDVESRTSYTDGWISNNGAFVVNMATASSYDWQFTLRGETYYADEQIIDNVSLFDIYNNTEQIASDVENGGDFTITEPIGFYRYYYTIQSAEIGANKQIVLTLRLNTFQTYVINPQLQFSECFINKAHLDRFLDNGNGTVSFNGGIESPLFEREEAQNVAKRLVNREVLKYDYGRYQPEDYAPGQIEQFKRVEDWLQSNIMGWLYAFFPKGKTAVYNLEVIRDAGQSIEMVNVAFPTQRYRTFTGGDSIDGNFVVFACPIYKTSKRIILSKTYENNTRHVTIKIHKDGLMNYLQSVLTTGSDAQPIAYTLKFSTKPPISDMNSSLMGFDVDANGNLVSIANSTYINKDNPDDNHYTSLSCYDFKAVRTILNRGDYYQDGSNQYWNETGCMVCENSFLHTLYPEDYNIINPVVFPKNSSSYIEKTFFRISAFNLAKNPPQEIIIERPGISIRNISITVSYDEAIPVVPIGSSVNDYVGYYIFYGDYLKFVDNNNKNSLGIVPGETSKYRKVGNIGTYEIENTEGRFTLESGRYEITIKNSYIVFEITRSPEGFAQWNYISFQERIYGLVGADKSPIYNPKLLNSDYRSLRLTNERGSEFEYDIQKLNTEVLQTAVSEQITADLQRTYFRAINTDGVYQEKCSQNLTGLVDSAETSMPLAADPWRKALAEQPNFFKERTYRNIRKVFGGALGGALGGGSNIGLQGGPVGAMAGAVVGGVTAGADAYINDKFSDDNMDKQPASIQNANGNVIFNLSYTTPGMTIEQYALLPQEERIINDQMFANGYTYNRIDQIRNFTHTRKYFNTIKALVETMSGLPLSNEVREDIRQRFANGIRLWHTDEIQYEKENYELWLEE